jgi:HSP20 family protein
MQGPRKRPPPGDSTMRVIKWEPFRDVDDMFERVFADTMRRWPRTSNDERRVYDWAPAADVSETDGEYIIKAELPEVRKDDLNITVQEGVLTLAGERKEEKREDNEKLHRIERFHGSFSRRFTLPDDADEQGIKAESKDGVLVIHIPKQKVAHPQPRQIQVQ